MNAVKRLQTAAAKAEEMFRNFAGEDPGACLTAGSAEAEAVEMADELQAASAVVDVMYTFAQNCARPGDIANVVMERDQLREKFTELLTVCKNIARDPYLTCSCADRLSEAIKGAEGQ